jgi:hypothetical protein
MFRHVGAQQCKTDFGGPKIPTHRWITEKPMTGAAMNLTGGIAGAKAKPWKQRARDKTGYAAQVKAGWIL